MYRRELSPNELKSVRLKYDKYIENARGGFLTKNQKLRLLKLKHGEEGTTEADFWYRLKQSAKGAIADLQMIFDIADDEQIKEIFHKIPLSKVKKKEIITDADLVSIDRLIASVLVSDWKNKNKDDLWKAILVDYIMESCLNYIITTGILMTQSHMRLIEEMRDLVKAIVGVAIQVPKDRRDGVII